MKQLNPCLMLPIPLILSKFKLVKIPKTLGPAGVYLKPNLGLKYKPMYNTISQPFKYRNIVFQYGFATD